MSLSENNVNKHLSYGFLTQLAANQSTVKLTRGQLCPNGNAVASLFVQDVSLPSQCHHLDAFICPACASVVQLKPETKPQL